MGKTPEPEVTCPQVNTPEDDQILCLNVGGSKFMTYRRTIQKVAECRLADDSFLSNHYSDTLGEYFFDRDPDMFRAMLNYMRSGELHLPSYICGPAAKSEMEFWGIAPRDIEQCCWMNYNEWNSTQKALKRLEHDRKILGFISVLFVVLSIFSFLAETTEPFEHLIAVPENAAYSNNVTSYHNKNTSLPVDTNSTAGNASADGTSEPVNYMKVKHPVLYYIDLVCVLFFSLEYIIRLIFAPRKLKYVTSLLAVIDILAILPDVIELLVYHIRPDLQADVGAVNYITILRVMRVLRIFRLVRHSPGLWILVYTLKASFSELVLLVWFVGIGMLLFSSLVYYVEDREDFKSIPDGFWWAVITMTTVGYGDMYPRTGMGKVVGSVCAMSGVLMIGFTVPALVNNFMLYYRHVQFAVFCEENQGKDSPDNTSSDDSLSSSGKLDPLSSSEKKSLNGGFEETPLMAKLHVFPGV